MVGNSEQLRPVVFTEYMARSLGALQLANVHPGNGDYRTISPDKFVSLEILDGVDKQPVSLETAFPRNQDALTEQFAQAFVDGTIPVEQIEKAGGAFFQITYPIDEVDVAAKGLTELFNAKDEAAYTDPKGKELDALITPEQRLDRVRQQTKERPGVLDRLFIDDLEDIEGLRDLEKLSEAFEFTISPLEGKHGTDNQTVRILNFSDTLLTQEQLVDFADALRFIADLSSGDLSDQLHTVIILPKGHPSLMAEFKREDGSTEWLPRNGYQAPHMIALSEMSLSAKRPEMTDKVKAYLSSYLKEGESLETINTTVSRGIWRRSLIHELVHIAFSGLPSYADKVSVLAMVSLYARVASERASEEVTALFIDWDDPNVSEEARRVLGEMWQLIRKRREDKKQPTGPHRIMGREIDLRQGALRPRPRNPGESLRTKTKYKRTKKTTAPPS